LDKTEQIVLPILAVELVVVEYSMVETGAMQVRVEIPVQVGAEVGHLGGFIATFHRLYILPVAEVVEAGTVPIKRENPRTMKM
jgi:hypothetical protein